MTIPISKLVCTLNLELLTLFRNETSVHYFFFSIFILRPIRAVKLKKTSLGETFEEMSKVHSRNMFYPYCCTESSSLVNVSP